MNYESTSKIEKEIKTNQKRRELRGWGHVLGLWFARSFQQISWAAVPAARNRISICMVTHLYTSHIDILIVRIKLETPMKPLRAALRECLL